MTDSLPYELRVPVGDAFDATIGFVVDESDEIGRCAGRLPGEARVCQPGGNFPGGGYAATAPVGAHVFGTAPKPQPRG